MMKFVENEIKNCYKKLTMIYWVKNITKPKAKGFFLAKEMTSIETENEKSIT